MRVTRGRTYSISDVTIDANIDMNSYGFTELGNMELVKNAGLQFLVATLTDGEWCGMTVLGIAGENVTAGEVCYLKSDGKFWLTDANDSAKMPVKVIATEAILADASGVFMLVGFIRVDAWNWTIGDVLYASATPGAMTATAPSGSGDQVQRLAIAVTADSIEFRPSKDVLELV